MKIHKPTKNKTKQHEGKQNRKWKPNTSAATTPTTTAH